MFAVVVFMSIATTLIAPPVLAQLYRNREEEVERRRFGLDRD